MLLLPGRSPEEKLTSLEKEFGIMVTKDSEGKVKGICNLSELYWEEAMDKGFKKGEEEGRKEGCKESLKEGILTSIRAMMKSTPYSV